MRMEDPRELAQSDLRVAAHRERFANSSSEPRLLDWQRKLDPRQLADRAAVTTSSGCVSVGAKFTGCAAPVAARQVRCELVGRRERVEASLERPLDAEGLW